MLCMNWLQVQLHTYLLTECQNSCSDGYIVLVLSCRKKPLSTLKGVWNLLASWILSPSYGPCKFLVKSQNWVCKIKSFTIHTYRKKHDHSYHQIFSLTNDQKRIPISSNDGLIFFCNLSQIHNFNFQIIFKLNTFLFFTYSLLRMIVCRSLIRQATYFTSLSESQILQIIFLSFANLSQLKISLFFILSHVFRKT